MGEPKTIIIQAGGKGTRIYPHSKNKPKILLAVNGKNILQNFLKIFDGYKFIIIGDYKFDILLKYVNTLYKDKGITLIRTKNKGNSSGLKEALSYLKEDESFIYTWSDLLFSEKPAVDCYKKNIIGLSNEFECRYYYANGEIVKGASSKDGIAGFFIFKSKVEISDVKDGESFVSGYLKSKNIDFEKIYLNNTHELGTINNIQEYNAKNKFSRFFNTIHFEKDRVVKTVVDKRYKHLIETESRWYDELKHKKLKFIPNCVLKDNNLFLEKIEGKHAFEINLKEKDKRTVIKNCVEMLKKLHNTKQEVGYNEEDYEDIFVTKTFERIESVKALIPFVGEEELNINKKYYLNPFSDNNIEEFKKEIRSIKKEKYKFIHGDCTFSNILVDKDLNTYLIDPRGKFGKTEMYGDQKYDYSKLYYSIVGNYDSINMKKYNLDITKDGVQYEIKSNGYSYLENYFFDLLDINKKQIKMIHSLIWFSLSGYVIEDYDSILLSFYNGVKTWNDRNEI